MVAFPWPPLPFGVGRNFISIVPNPFKGTLAVPIGTVCRIKKSGYVSLGHDYITFFSGVYLVRLMNLAVNCSRWDHP